MKLLATILIVIICAFPAHGVYGQTKSLDDILKAIDGTQNANGTTNQNASFDFTGFARDGIYGCQGIGQVGPVGQRHAAGTFVPVSEEAVALNTFILVNKFCVLDGLNVRQREALVSGLLRAAVSGINKGPDGRTQYSQNVPQEMRERSDEVAQKFLEDESLNNICAPYRDSVKQAVLRNYQNRTRKQTSTYACKFPGTPDQLQKLLDGNLDEGGGFAAYLSLLQSGNDPLSAYTYANETLNRAIQTTQENDLRELEWGNGFRSQKECTQVPSGNGKYEEQCNIVTPGKVISDMASYVSQTGFRQTENADQIDELLGGFISNFQNQVLSSFTGFKGSTESRNGQPSYLDKTVQDSFGRATGETTTVGVDALKKALDLETQYVSVRTATKKLLEDFVTKLLRLEDVCYTKLIDKAKEDTKKKLEDRVCGGDGQNYGNCGASVTDTESDAPGSSESNPKKYHLIVARSGTERETVKLLITRDKSLAIINSEVRPLLSAITTSITNGQKALTALQKLNQMLADNKNPSITRFVLEQLDQMVAGKALHGSGDVSNATDQRSQVNDALNLLYDKTKSDWEKSWCKEEKWTDFQVNN